MNFIVSLVVLLLVVAIAVGMYNGLIKLRNRVKEAWSDIDVQLKRRYNLIPNIVESVKGYAAHEENVFTKVTEARSNAINATGIKGQGQAENMLSGALKSLFAVAESYPDLKANQNFLQLQNELVDTEDKIQAARRFYNGVVRDLNTKVEQVPNNIIANMFNFKVEEFFEIEKEEERKNVEVSFKETPTVTPAPINPTPVQPAPEVKPVVPVEPITPIEPVVEIDPIPLENTVPAEEKPADNSINQ